jgi:hypothetical protein
LAREKASKETASVRHSPGWWDSAVRPILERRAFAIALVFILMGCVRIPLGASKLGLTVDEPQHFACGLEYLAKHVYRYETQHPPLARAMTALLPYLSGARPTGNRDREDEGTGILIHSADPDRFLASMRLGTLPFFVLASLIVFFWGRWAFDAVTAVAATALFTLLPPVLAHAGLATTDMGLTACLAAAFYAAIRWAESPAMGRAVIFGLATAAATLAKFTTLIFFPAAMVLALLGWYAAARPSAADVARLLRARAGGFGVAVAVGALVIWGAYFFHFDKLPAPEFFDGIRSVISHNDEGHQSYLLGKVSTSGFWYYFPVVLGVKTPIAFLILLGIGVWLAWSNRTRVSYLLPAAFVLSTLLPAMMGRINIGVRHILPVYVGFALLAALGLLWLARQPRLVWLAVALPLWMTVSGAASHPDYLAYFNEIGGSEPERIIVDSDLDWNQSTKALAHRLHELGATSVNFGVNNGRSKYMETWPGLPPIRPVHPVIPAEGWTAIRPTVDKTTQYGLFYRYPDRQPWWEQMQPKERVGSILLYYIAPGTFRLR